jgi:Rrf2 family protein
MRNEGGNAMKISTKGRYALRLMLDLAVNNTGEYITIKSIAARQEISEKYLEQIISLLNRAGYVRSVRGAQGGYRLAKDPSEYTVGMILRLTEGSLAPIDCLDDELQECNRQSSCVTKFVWKELYDAITSVVDRITLQDLVDKQMSMVPFDYSI